MMWDHPSWNATTWFAIALTLLILLWAGLALMVVGLARKSRTGPIGRSGGLVGGISHADEMLAEQFIRGEIDESEFIRCRQALHNTPGPRGSVDQRREEPRRWRRQHFLFRA